jgi:hypothetical protein
MSLGIPLWDRRQVSNPGFSEALSLDPLLATQLTCSSRFDLDRGGHMASHRTSVLDSRQTRVHVSRDRRDQPGDVRLPGPMCVMWGYASGDPRAALMQKCMWAVWPG